MRRRTTCTWLLQPLLFAVLFSLWSGPGWSQEADTKPAEPATAAPAETPAAAPAAAPDPAASPTTPDSTGASYTGASTTSALTKDGDKITPATIAQDVKALKLGLNIFWTLL